MFSLLAIASLFGVKFEKNLISGDLDYRICAEPRIILICKKGIGGIAI